ncbi:GNAT family N-acetyltransferase [Gilvimarinus sp. F26214L]|uniref:GNAT family N-acetyltransferase n=1 Tax=Gilvimarinus sp. DZF01 TaxID=3461371 RepID=UPI0040455FCB
MEFKRCVSLSEEERRRLYGWGHDIFRSEGLHLIWRPKQVSLVLHQQNSPLSTCGLIRQSVRVGERTLEVGGIGGVATPPDLQGWGYAGRVLTEALRIFKEEWSLDAGMLFCREALVPFYQRHGWQRLDETVVILQPQGMIPCPTQVMVFPLRGEWPRGSIAVDSLPW